MYGRNTYVDFIRDVQDLLKGREDLDEAAKSLLERCNDMLDGPAYWELIALDRMTGEQITDELSKSEQEEYEKSY